MSLEGRNVVREDLGLWGLKQTVELLFCLIEPDLRDSMLFIKFPGSFNFPSDNSHVKMKISMEHWWNDTDRGN
jgi:hypothetical protein